MVNIENNKPDRSRGLFSSFISLQGGNITIVTVILLPVIIGVAALAIDYGVWKYQKRQLQAIADAAALGGSQAIRQSKASYVTSYATADALLNGFTVGAGQIITVNNPPSSGVQAGNSKAVEVLLEKPSNRYLSSLFLPSSPTIRARSVSKVSYANACLITLSNTSGLTLNGTAAAVMPNCGVYVNANGSGAVTQNGASSLVAESVSAVGGISGSNITVTGGQFPYSQPIQDPYASLAIPSSGSCDYNNFSSKITQTINPGTYCNGFSLKAGANVTMSPGTYIISGGKVTVNASTSLTGTGVTIVLTGSSGNYADVTINGGANVNLSAPTTGSLKGMLFIGDRNATGVTHTFNGGSTNIFNGIIYTPAADLKFAGNATSTGACTQIISNSLTISGTSGFGSGCATSPFTQIGTSSLSE